jgi:hypothetical protein
VQPLLSSGDAIGIAHSPSREEPEAPSVYFLGNIISKADAVLNFKVHLTQPKLKDQIAFTLS